MEKARLVSLLARLRYAHNIIKHQPLRKEIAALERIICAHFGHTPSTTEICCVCEQRLDVVGVGVAISSNNSTAAIGQTRTPKRMVAWKSRIRKPTPRVGF